MYYPAKTKSEDDYAYKKNQPKSYLIFVLARSLNIVRVTNTVVKNLQI